MFQVRVDDQEYDVQFRYGIKDFPWKYNPKDEKEEWKVETCRFTECIISHMGKQVGEDEKGNPVYDDKVLVIHQERCSNQDNFKRDKGRKEALKNSLLVLFPGKENRRARYEFWMHYFASQIMSRLSTKDEPLHPRTWRPVNINI